MDYLIWYNGGWLPDEVRKKIKEIGCSSEIIGEPYAYAGHAEIILCPTEEQATAAGEEILKYEEEAHASFIKEGLYQPKVPIFKKVRELTLQQPPTPLPY